MTDASKVVAKDREQAPDGQSVEDLAVAELDPVEVAREAEEIAFFSTARASRAVPDPSPQSRVEGWERRYQAVLDRAAREPYVLGSHDCFRVACAVLEALTGVDRWPEFAGRYRTYRQSLVILREYADKAVAEREADTHHPSPITHHPKASTFDDAFDGFFGIGHCAASFARRGDVVKVLDPNGTAHLGVCIGREIAVLRETGLMTVPL